MKVKTYLQNFIKVVATFALALLVGFPWQTVTPTRVSAYTEGANLYDSTPVLEDLGEDYILKFPEIPGAEPKLNSFVEYSYSDNAFTRNASYGLYLYIYNPSRTKYSTKTGASVVNMATAYNSEGNPSEYSLLPLKVCGYTTGKYDKLFYKFRIMNVEKVLNNAVAQEANNGKRRYDIATIQLKSDSGVSEAMKKGVSKTFYYSGYAQGCGKGAENESTLNVEIKELETVNLEVKHANYRTGDYYDYVCDEINTVYFSVPEKFFESYGALQKIKASWYEYKTNPIFITSDSGAFSALMNYRNKDIGEHTTMDELAWRVLWEESSATVVGPTGLKDKINIFYKAYNGAVEKLNHEDESKGWGLVETTEHVTRLDWLFLRDYNGDVNDYKVTSTEMLEYMQSYTNSFPSQEKVAGKYAEDLFAESIDADRLALLENPQAQRGYIEQEIDAGETQNLLVKKEQSKWDEFWHGAKYEETGIAPIVVLTKNDMTGLNADSFAKKYYIGDTDKTRVFNDIKAMLNKGERAVLFRFAVTDYYLSQARYDEAGDRSGIFDGKIDMSDKDGYVAQETMFLDFTIITLTFRKDSVDTVIPCVAKPIDIINGIDTFPEDDYNKPGNDGWGLRDILEFFLGIIVLLFVVWAVCKVLGWVINALRRGGG